MVTKQVSQETTIKATISPIFQPELAEIRAKLTEWDQRFGPGLIALWVCESAFNQVYESKGFDFANAWLTQARFSLRRSEGAVSLDWRRRIKKAEAQSKAEKPPQDSAEAA